MSIEKKIDNSLYAPYNDTEVVFDFETLPGQPGGIRWDSIYVEVVESSISADKNYIDTSQIDKYRQGVELQTDSQYSAGIVRIYEGDKNHFSKQNHFGQRTVLQNYDYQKTFSDVNTFESLEASQNDDKYLRNLIDIEKSSKSQMLDTMWISNLPELKKNEARNALLFNKLKQEPIVKKIINLEYENGEGSLEPISIRAYSVAKGDNNKKIINSLKCQFSSGNEESDGNCSVVTIVEKIIYVKNNPYKDESFGIEKKNNEFITQTPSYKDQENSDPFVDIEKCLPRNQLSSNASKIPTGIIINSNMKNDVELISQLLSLHPNEYHTKNPDDKYSCCGAQQEYSRYGTDSIAFSKDYRGQIQIYEEEFIS